ncbi:metallophosphoesterase [Pyrobaculum islandicum]|uniref:metallophosphoesterase n=1 Tax=Pyrobaculum islandicum TaxID=2277 RepID=UPI00069DA6E3|nr:metallophosphoesterase [Pyrobaculum islandicum]
MRGVVLPLRHEKILLLADTHVGYEVELRRERGINIISQTNRLVEKILELADFHNVSSVAILGDVKHELPIPRESIDEVKTFLRAIAKKVPLLLIPGNHDSLLQEIAADIEGVEITSARGVLLNKFLLLHGHVKPVAQDLEKAEVIVMGHTHPAVVIRDEIGYTVKEPAILKIYTSRTKLCKSLYGEPCKRRGKISIVILPAAHPLITGVDVKEIPQLISSGRTILKHIEWNAENIEVYLTDMTFLGTLADLQNVA